MKQILKVYSPVVQDEMQRTDERIPYCRKAVAEAFQKKPLRIRQYTPQDECVNLYTLVMDIEYDPYLFPLGFAAEDYAIIAREYDDNEYLYTFHVGYLTAECFENKQRVTVCVSLAKDASKGVGGIIYPKNICWC